MQIQDYLNNRVENQLSYYSKKSAENKEGYHRYKTIQMVAAALLPFVSAFITDYDWTKYLVALLGTLVTVMEGVLSIGKYHEKWVTYRTTAENLRQEKFLFLMNAGNYGTTDASQQFVNKIEMILGKETTGWQQIVLKDSARPEAIPGQPTGNNQSTPTPVTTGDQQNNTAEPMPTDPITGIPSDPEIDDYDKVG